MRAKSTANGVSVKAYAGTTGVLLAYDVTAAKRRGLLGFALERTGPGRRHRWLPQMRVFPGVERAPGQLVSTELAPNQRFRWSDYTVAPKTRYRYTIHPVYGTPPNDLTLERGPSVTVTTARLDGGEHAVIFNRAAAASQAFSRDFPEVEAAMDAARKADRPLPPLPPRALDWLSRGCVEQIIGFVDRAGRGEALDIAIYEYELPAIIAAIERADRRGVKVRLVYHAKKGDEQTEINRAAASGLPERCRRERVTHKICHHKFIVLSSTSGGDRRPRAVLCGSTNFTENGVYRQANVVHVVSRQDVAKRYLELFEVLFRGDDPGQTREYIDTANRMDDRGRVFSGFSARSRPDDLARFAEIVKGAKKDVLFSTAFDLYDDLEDALLGEAGDPILRYGIQNSRSRITGFRRDRNVDFAATAMLNEGLEGFLKESTRGQKGNILIHTKLIVVDFTSDRPTVISGSHNLSKSASSGNDENFLIVRDRDVADCYGVELMRIYDHYRFRYHVRDGKGEPQTLTEDDSWTDPYFERGSLKRLDRLRFAGRAL